MRTSSSVPMPPSASALAARSPAARSAYRPSVTKTSRSPSITTQASEPPNPVSQRMLVACDSTIVRPSMAARTAATRPAKSDAASSPITRPPYRLASTHSCQGIAARRPARCRQRPRSPVGRRARRSIRRAPSCHDRPDRPVDHHPRRRESSVGRPYVPPTTDRCSSTRLRSMRPRWAANSAA